MASGSDPDARVAELAALSGEKLVDLLSTTSRRTDFEAVARVLKARDRRFAEVKAALSHIDGLRKKYDVILDASRRPRDEAVEMAPLLRIASRDSVQHPDEPRVEEMEDVPLSRRLKRLRQGETSDLESGKRDGQGQSDSAGTMGNYGQKSSSARSVHSVGLKERIGQPVGSSTPKDPKQGRGIVEAEKWGGAVPRTVPLFFPVLLDRSVLPKGSSESDHGRARTGNKQGSSDGILSTGVIQSSPKGNGKIIKTSSMLESSSRSANKETGSVMKKCPPACRQTEDGMIAKGGNPMLEATMVASSSLSIRSLTAAEFLAYGLKPKPAPPASCTKNKTQNVRDLAKGGKPKKLVDVSSEKKLVGGD